jgi:tRNA threonylcarbamoyladenosine biosynthesis protein TsaE
VILETQTLHWPDEAACAATATRLAGHPALRTACIELHGPLGAGKTTLTRHLLRALGVTGRIKSPSYAIVEPYTLPATANAPEGAAWHFDFYRFGDPREWEDAGFREPFASAGLKLVEWPERAAGLLPTADLVVTLQPQLDGTRTVVLAAGTALGVQLLAP